MGKGKNVSSDPIVSFLLSWFESLPLTFQLAKGSKSGSRTEGSTTSGPKKPWEPTSSRMTK